MKLSKEQRIRLYETVMNKIAPVVYNRLYEMSDELLDRAIVASIDKGDVQKAKKFSDYKNSESRKGERTVPSIEQLNQKIVTAVESGDYKMAKKLSDYKKRQFSNG